MNNELLGLLTLIMAGICLLALLFLSTRAFRKNAAWGLSVLLLPPFAATVFGIRHWNREKVPFIAFTGTFLLTTAMMVSLFGAWGGWELVTATRSAQQALQSRTLTQSDADAFLKASLSFNENAGISYRNNQLQKQIQRELDRNAEKAMIEAQSAEEKTYTTEDLYRLEPVKKERYRLTYRTIKAADAHKYVGSTVKVTRKNVPEREYRLTGVSGGSLQFAQKNRKGSYSFSFKQRDIANIRVLIKETR